MLTTQLMDALKMSAPPVTLEQWTAGANAGDDGYYKTFTIATGDVGSTLWLCSFSLIGTNFTWPGSVHTFFGLAKDPGGTAGDISSYTGNPWVFGAQDEGLGQGPNLFMSGPIPYKFTATGTYQAHVGTLGFYGNHGHQVGWYWDR